MKRYHLHLTSFVVLVASLLAPFMAEESRAQYIYPTFKKVSVKANAQGKAEADIEYIAISNASQSTILTHIDNLNRKKVFGDEVIYIGNQAAANKIALELTEYYYDGIFAIPSQTTRQSVQVIRGGKYITFYTDIFIYFGGANGMPISATECYNLQNGNVLNLAYLSTGSWRAALKRAIYNKCCTRVETLFCTYDDIEIPTMCALTEFGVQFFFPTGEIAANVEGPIIIEISDDELRSMGVPIRW